MRKMTSLALAIAMVPAFAAGTLTAGERENITIFHLAQNDTQTEEDTMPPGAGEDDQQEQELEEQQQQQEQDADLEVQVEEEPAEIQIQQEAPDIEVEQAPPEVEIDQPEPEVQIEQPEPTIEVDQAEPEVDIQQEGEPEVDIQRTEEPQVDIQDQEQEMDQEMDQDQPGEPGEEANGIMAMQAGDLEGETVYNQDGQDIGEIQHIAREEATGELHAIINVGGFWGVGGSEIALPIDEFSVQNNQLVLRTNRTEEQIEQDADEYDDQNFTQVDSGMTLQQAQ